MGFGLVGPQTPRDRSGHAQANDADDHVSIHRPHDSIRSDGPAMQDAIFPTAAYVGGPAEIAYFAQAGVVHEELLGRITPVLPAVAPWSGVRAVSPSISSMRPV